jgi:hypothetical protein
MKLSKQFANEIAIHKKTPIDKVWTVALGRDSLINV